MAAVITQSTPANSLTPQQYLAYAQSITGQSSSTAPQSTPYTSTQLGGTPTPVSSGGSSYSPQSTPYTSTQVGGTPQLVAPEPVSSPISTPTTSTTLAGSSSFGSTSTLSYIPLSNSLYQNSQVQQTSSPLAFGLSSGSSGAGFAGIGESFTGLIKAPLNLGFRIGETVSNDIRFGIGRSGFVNGYDAKLNPIQPVTTFDYIKQWTGYSSLTSTRDILMPVNTIFATSILAENPIKPSVSFLGTESRVTMAGTAADLKPQVSTNFFFRSEAPSAGGLMSESSFGIAKGTLKINSFAESTQTGRGYVAGGFEKGYNLLNPSNPGNPTFFNSRQFMTASTIENPQLGLYPGGVTRTFIGEANLQKTIGEVSTINPVTLEAYSSRGFIGRSINFEKQVGETSVQYVKGDTSFVKNQIPTKAGSFEGVIFKNPISTGKGAGSDIVSFQGGGKPSSPEFFQNLYSQNIKSTSSSVSAAVSLPKSSELSFSLPKSFPSISSPSQIPESQYYGTGTYERTSDLSSAFQLNNQIQKGNEFQIIQNNLRLSNDNIQRLWSGNSQIQNNIPIQIQPSINTNIQTNFQIQNQLQLQNQITTTITPPIIPPPITPIPNPPPIIPFKFLPGGSSDLGLRNFRGKRKTRYTPDFGSLAFNIRGSYKGGRLSKSGVDFRPITPGFSFDTGLGGTSSTATFKKFTDNLSKTRLFKTKFKKRKKR